MSNLEVKVRDDYRILQHPNADRLELAEIGGSGGYQCVVGKGEFTPGKDLLIYIPVDSMITPEMSEKLSAECKIQIGPRIRAVKIRKFVSQGLCLTTDWLENKADRVAGKDVTDILGIRKYQPPQPGWKGIASRGVNIAYVNENFDQYTDIEHFRKYPGLLEAKHQVYVTIKYHGTNFRCGIVRKPFRRRSPFINQLFKILDYFGLGPNPWEFLVGSHRKIRKFKASIGRKFVDDIYWKTAEKYDIRKICEKYLYSCPDKEEIVIYGETVAPGIQKGYDYGLDSGDVGLYIFDVKVDGKYQDWTWVKQFCKIYDLPLVEEIYRGPWNLDILKLAETVDEYKGRKCAREGIVIKPLKESWHPRLGRVIMKHINSAYLLDATNSDFH